MGRTARVIDSHCTSPIARRGGQAIPIPIANDFAGCCHPVGESYAAPGHNEQVRVAVHSAAEPHLWARVYRQVAVVEYAELENGYLVVVELAAQVNLGAIPRGCGRIQPPTIPQTRQPIVWSGSYGDLCRAWRRHRSDVLREIKTRQARCQVCDCREVVR